MTQLEAAFASFGACGRSLSKYINLGRDVADGVVGVRLLLKSHLTAPSLRLVS
jgi:hypothetical protein